jgi:hypothetical protein
MFVGSVGPADIFISPLVMMMNLLKAKTVQSMTQNLVSLFPNYYTKKQYLYIYLVLIIFT